MPDWSYHPFFKPLLFQLPAEMSRRLTIGALAVQSKSSLGRWIFRLLSAKPPTPNAAVTVFGLNFPTVVGLGPGIDTHGDALQFFKDHFGFGFLELGPVAHQEQLYHSQHNPQRLPEQFAITRSAMAAAPSSLSLAQKVKTAGGKKIPIAFCLRGKNCYQALVDAEPHVDFFTLPQECLDDNALITSLRAATKKPLLIRLTPPPSLAALDATIQRAIQTGINGCIAITNEQIEGPFLKDQALQTIRHTNKRYGTRFPIIGTGGITTPEDALDFLSAGASLVEIASGFVYAGPGLPMRIVRARAANPAASDVVSSLEQKNFSPQVAGYKTPYGGITAKNFSAKAGWRLLALVGIILMAAGLVALLLAATIKLLPPDTRYLGMTVAQLCNRNACRIVHFMAHDRVSFGGSIFSIGIIYTWLAAVPLRDGEPWAWWTFIVSGFVGFLSFLTYLGYGYLDIWHGLATLALMPIFICGLFFSWTTLHGKRNITSLFCCGDVTWLWSSINIGRMALSFCTFGMISGGLIIMLVGMTHVFVPQDLEFMQVTVPELNFLNPRLISLIAHDRAGFGGGLCSGGLAILLTVWCGVRPGERVLWWALFFAGLIGFSTAIGVHPVIGYLSFIHLLPAYLGALAFAYGMAFLYKPLCQNNHVKIDKPNLFT